MFEFELLPWKVFLKFLDEDDLKALFQSCPSVLRAARHPSKRQFLLGRNLPRIVRLDIWDSFLNPPGSSTQPPLDPNQQYSELLKAKSSYDTMINRDVGRTLPQHEAFEKKNSIGTLALKNILHAASLRLWDVGYCQGMNFLAATIFLLTRDEERAFDLFLSLLLRYNIAEYYRPTFPRLSVASFQMDVFVEAFLPAVHGALARFGLTAEYYAMQWFLTLYAYDLDQEVVWCIWDMFLLSGWRIIFQVGLALLETAQDEILTLDYDHTLRYLKNFVQQLEISGPELLKRASRFRVSTRMLSVRILTTIKTFLALLLKS